MTRINLIKPKKLLDQHLMAEYRELPMVMGALKRSIRAKKFPIISNRYLLNKGHVSFFYNKRDFLEKRFILLIDELRNRNYDIDPSSRNVNFDIFDYAPCKQIIWEPDEKEININIERILLRYEAKKNFYKYFSKSMGDAPIKIKEFYKI